MRLPVKRYLIGILFLLLSTTAKGGNYDFEQDGFYYIVQSLENLTCSISHWDRQRVGTDTGRLIIPERVTFKGRTFTVIGIGKRIRENWTTPSTTGNDIRSVRYIEIPKTIQWIGSNSFLDYVNVDQLVLKGGGNIYTCAFCFVNAKTVIVGDGVGSMDEDAISCSKVSTVRIEDTDKPLMIYGSRDHGISATRLYIGRNITFKRETDYSFTNHRGITELEIGPKVTELPSFSQCRLDRLISHAIRAPKLSAPFSSYTENNCIVTLPQGATGYKESSWWAKIL